MGIDAPLGMQDLLINTVTGTADLFYFLAVAFLAILAARFKMQNGVFLILIGLFGLMVATVVGEQIYFLTVFIMGLVTALLILRSLK